MKTEPKNGFGRHGLPGPGRGTGPWAPGPGPPGPPGPRPGPRAPGARGPGPRGTGPWAPEEARAPRAPGPPAPGPGARSLGWWRKLAGHGRARPGGQCLRAGPGACRRPKVSVRLLIHNLLLCHVCLLPHPLPHPNGPAPPYPPGGIRSYWAPSKSIVIKPTFRQRLGLYGGFTRDIKTMILPLIFLAALRRSPAGVAP